MNQFSCVLLLQFILTNICSSSVPSYDHVSIPVKKQVDVNKLSSKKFFELNLAHVMISYMEPGSIPNTLDPKKMKGFHDLQYTGEITVGDTRLNVIFETAIPDTIVLSGFKCKFPQNLVSPFCWFHHNYKVSKDVVHVWDGNFPPTFSLFDQQTPGIKGHLIFEKLKIGKTTISQTLVGVIDTWGESYIFGKADGIVGLGRPQDSYFLYETVVKALPGDMNKIKNCASLMESLHQMGVGVISYQLHGTKNGHEVGLINVGADQKYYYVQYAGEVTWLDKPEVEAYYWRVVVSEIMFLETGIGEIQRINLQNDEAGFAVLDPGTSLVAGPTALIKKVHDTMFMNLAFKRVDKYGSVEFECVYLDHLPILVFVISGKGYVMPPKTYVRQLKNTCTTGFMGIDGLTNFIIGDTFFKKYVVAFDGANQQIGLLEQSPLR